MGKTKVKDLKDSEEYTKIRDSLINAITLEKNTNEDVIPKYCLDMLDNYMSLWTVSKALMQDIEKRGVVVKWDNGGGQKGMKKNESIAELNKTILQMTKLLESLGINKIELDDGGNEL